MSSVFGLNRALTLNNENPSVGESKSKKVFAKWGALD